MPRRKPKYKIVVLSKPGSALKIEQIQLTPDQQRSLTTNVESISGPKKAVSPSTASTGSASPQKSADTSEK